MILHESLTKKQRKIRYGTFKEFSKYFSIMKKIEIPEQYKGTSKNPKFCKFGNVFSGFFDYKFYKKIGF